jgi:hypothetical protein
MLELNLNAKKSSSKVKMIINNRAGADVLTLATLKLQHFGLLQELAPK